MTAGRPLNVAFVHPDLGIGGAERLVLDAATELRRFGHEVTIFAGAFDPARCFDEARDGSLDVRVAAGARRIPPHVAGRLRAPLAILRTRGAARAAVRERERPFDVVVCDLVAHAIPALQRSRRPSPPVLFYVHYPDRLLAPAGGGPAYRLYRAAIDRLEETSVARARRVVANSRFTVGAFRSAFPRLEGRPVDVVYPGVRVPATSAPPPVGGEITVISISRFEAKKNVALAVEAFARFLGRATTERARRTRLVLAGGYDERLADNRTTLAALRERVAALGLAASVDFRPSVGDAERREMLEQTACVLYTPSDEHFGLVPVEAMAAARPVVAVASGGPLETILDGETGFLRAPEPDAFAGALELVIGDPERAARMGEAGRERARTHFSIERFGAEFERVVRETAETG